ncbi:MAG: DUF167 domain-containing protein [Candidatus Gastranaerophilales bacterium]|nr:DUF167 domain-containing protein [Candidatus Gastranaerophilales bacterium]
MEDNFSFLNQIENGTVLSVKLVPNSSYSKIIDYTQEYLRIKISSPAVENRANKELVSFCAKTFDINKSQIEIISGEKSKLKKILFKKINKDKIIQKLLFVLDSK